MTTGIVGVRGASLIIPYQSATKRTKQVTLSLTDNAGTITTNYLGIGLAYADSLGNWRLIFNFDFISGSNASHVVTISGVTFATTSGVQAFSCFGINLGTAAIHAWTTPNADTLHIQLTGNDTRISASGDVALASKPTWADANMEGVVAADIYIPFGQTGMPGDSNIGGGSIRSGTGGHIYSARNSNAITGSLTEMVYLTLNIGTYFVSGWTRAAMSSAGQIQAYFAIGGTQVSGTSYNFVNASTAAGSVSFAYPVVITADNTKVSIYASAPGTNNDSQHELSAVRLAP